MPSEVPKVPLPKDHKAEICIWADLPVTHTEAILAAAGNRGEILRLLKETFHLEDSDVNSRSAVLLDLYYFTIQYAIDNSFNKEQTSTFFSIVKKTHEVCVETPFGNLDQCFNYFKELVLCHSVKLLSSLLSCICNKLWLKTLSHFTFMFPQTEDWCIGCTAVCVVFDYRYRLFPKKSPMNGPRQFEILLKSRVSNRPPWSILLFSPDQVQKVTEYVVNTYFRHYKLYKYAFTPVVKLDLSISYLGLPESAEQEEAKQSPDPLQTAANVEDNETVAVQDGEEQTVDEQEEESAAHKELRKIITAQLNEEIAKLRLSLDEQIKQNDESLQQKLVSVEGLSPGKTGKGSAKTKKR